MVDIWINNDSESRTATKTQAGVHIPKERISIIGIDLDQSPEMAKNIATAISQKLKTK